MMFLAKILTIGDYAKVLTAKLTSGFIQIILSLVLNEIITQKKNLDKKPI